MSAINAAARGRGFDMSLHTHSHGHMHTLSHPHTHDERPKTPPPQEHHFQPQPLRQVMQPPPPMQQPRGPFDMGLVQRQLAEADERARAPLPPPPEHFHPSMVQPTQPQYPPEYYQPQYQSGYYQPQQQPPPPPQQKPTFARQSTQFVKQRREKKRAEKQQKASSAARKAVVLQWLSMIISVIIYFAVGTVVMHEFETDWTIIQGVYFCMVTMSTVGYGDFSPSTDGTKVFTVCWIFFGIIVVFSQLGACISQLINPVTRFGRGLLDRCFPKNLVDIDGDGDADFAYPRHFVIFYFKGLTPSLLLNVSVQMASAFAFHLIEGWHYGDAVYHCLVTATTVGYGDMSIQTEQGRLWATFHILFSVVLLAEAITSLNVLSEERRIAFERLEYINKQLDDNFLDGLLDEAAELRCESKDAPVSKVEEVSETEFVLCILLQTGVAKMSQVRPLIMKFRALDTDHSGKLGREDLESVMKEADASSRLDNAKPAPLSRAATTRLRRGNTRTVPTNLGGTMPPQHQPQAYQPAPLPMADFRQPQPDYSQPPQPDYSQPPSGSDQPVQAPPGFFRGASGIGATFARLDTNNDGQINEEQFRQFNVSVPTPTRGGAPTQQPPYIQSQQPYGDGGDAHRLPPALPPPHMPAPAMAAGSHDHGGSGVRRQPTCMSAQLPPVRPPQGGRGLPPPMYNR